ncbi:DUF305 family protein family protein [Homoserinimonas aerilata]|uniref:DUF305 family protein family protein n=1 Tax=Homoserinimonas aerilata TaxID=1162970 RepID=A0A542YH63_9MICO|nr:DUF305 domain-containing protein [Homoserinimonas aerilata]TQL47432.1 DUF305 family protein family protein [Homoserinimonas aerilata]
MTASEHEERNDGRNTTSHDGTNTPESATGSAKAKSDHGDGKHPGHGGSAKMYLKFGAILLVSLGLMWVLSMSMVRSIDHFYFNLSNFWMALLMVAAMAIVMLIGMWTMFKSTKTNIALLAGFAVLAVGVFALGRTETFVGNEQFLQSMIPHHSRAILVCEESNITDPEIIELCETIVETQQEEISQMETILDRYASE